MIFFRLPLESILHTLCDKNLASRLNKYIYIYIFIYLFIYTYIYIYIYIIFFLARRDVGLYASECLLKSENRHSNSPCVSHDIDLLLKKLQARRKKKRRKDMKRYAPYCIADGSTRTSRFN